MSTENTDSTKPIKKRTGTSQSKEEPILTNPETTESQAETRVVRKRSTRKQVETDAEGIQPLENKSASGSANLETSEETSAIHPSSEDEEPVSPARVKRGKWIWLGILMVLVMVLAGSGVGYASAMRVRAVEEENQRLLRATTQYELGLVDQQQGKLGIAQQRFQYVLSIYPDYPGLEDKLIEIGLLIGENQGAVVVPTQSIEPTPTVAITVVPTKSTGSTTILFDQAKAQMEGQDWAGLYTTLSTMREIDPAYKAVEVDGMWYLALRNRGIQLIQAGELEPGLYNFALAEQIAPIDADAESYFTWARMYINAGAFWEIDWYSAVQGFANLYPLVPQLRDASGITVTQRYSRALIGYGDYLQQNYDFCGAASSYRQASSIYSDASLPEKISQADEYCANPPATPTPTIDPSAPTPTPTPKNRR